MLSEAPEKLLRYVRFLLLGGWLFILFLCLVDIGQIQLTQPNDPAAIKSLVGNTIELREEVFVARPYNPATRMFWGLAVPIVVLILLFAGHDTWRRICPLSALSQIPRWLGFQRKRKQGTSQNIVLVSPTSFIARYAILIQFTLFAIGVWLRLTVLSANPMALFIFTMILFLVAFLTGLLFGGKTWCHYLCPMNAVQLTLSGPRGLNTAPPRAGLSQSMCRKPADNSHDSKGDVSTCVGCNSPCPDVDIERNYWEALPTLSRRITVYGYLGVVIAFIHGMFAATGNTTYGAAVWYDADWLATGYAPFGELLPVPKILGALLLFATWIFMCVVLGFVLEKILSLKSFTFKGATKDADNTKILAIKEAARHHSMTISTATALFLLIHKVAVPGLGWLPEIILNMLSVASTAAIAVWAYRSWNRTQQQYQRESLAESLRRKLGNMMHSWKNILSGRDLDSLSPDELHVVAELAPNLSNANKLNFYRAMLADTLEQGTAESFEGRKLLSQLRSSCNVSDAEHEAIVNELKGDYELDDSLFISASLRSNSFREQLERIIYEGIAAHKKIAQILEENAAVIEKLRGDYSISEDEENAIITDITKEDGAIPKTLHALIAQISHLRHMQLALNTSDQVSHSWAAKALSHYLETQAADVLIECFALIEALSPEEQHTQDIIKALAATHPALIQKYSLQLSSEFSLPKNFGSELTQFATRIIPADTENTTTLESTLRSLAQSDHQLIACIAARAAELNGLDWGHDSLNEKIHALCESQNIRLSNLEHLINTDDDQALMHILKIEGSYLQGNNTHGNSTHENSIEPLIFQGNITAGRSKSNDWVINQPQASRKHFALYQKEDGYYCEDLHSSNGTIIGTETIKGETIKLPPKGTLQVAHDASAFRFECLTIDAERLNHPIDAIALMFNNPLWLMLTPSDFITLLSTAQHIALADSHAHTLEETESYVCLVLRGKAMLSSTKGSTITLDSLSTLVADEPHFALKSIQSLEENTDVLVWHHNVFNASTHTNKAFCAELYKQSQQLLLAQLD